MKKTAPQPRQTEMNTNGHQVGGMIGSWQIMSFSWTPCETTAYCQKRLYAKDGGGLRKRTFKVWSQYRTTVKAGNQLAQRVARGEKIAAKVYQQPKAKMTSSQLDDLETYLRNG